jgi:hypothetical protein
MTAVEKNQITDLLQRVRDWPPPMRIALARRILETLEARSDEQPPPKVPRGPSAAEIAAMFQTGKPAPSDEEVRRVLEDELLGKYSS